jgi:hypothetical protein
MELSQIVTVRRAVIADSELQDIQDEYDRLLRRKNGTDIEGTQGERGIRNCHDFLAAYVPALLKAIEMMEKAAMPENDTELRQREKDFIAESEK